MGVTNEQLADLITTTLRDLPQGEFEVMWDSQAYKFCRLYQENRRTIDGGTSIQRNVMLDRQGRAQYRRLFDRDEPVVDQNMHTTNVPWTQVGTNYSWDKLEILRNRHSSKQIINLLQSRRTERMWDIAELIEERGWSAPDSATDTKHPYGVPYYANFLNAGESVGGFHGQTIRYRNGTTGTICAGIDAAVESKWRNYADVYDKVDNALLRKMRSAVRQTRFRPAPNVPRPGNDEVGNPIELYSSNDIVTELEDLADKRDDNTQPKDLAGKMLHNFNGTVFFNGMPVVYIPQLDNQVTVDGNGDEFAPDAIYCVDWSKLQPVVQDDYWMVESEPITDRGQHTVFTVFLDGSHNNLCTNRRTAAWVLHKLIPAAS